MSYLVSTLDQKIKDYIFFDEQTVRNIGIQMVRGIRDIHNTGYVLQDIRPENIMFKNED